MTLQMIIQRVRFRKSLNILLALYIRVYAAVQMTSCTLMPTASVQEQVNGVSDSDARNLETIGQKEISATAACSVIPRNGYQMNENECRPVQPVNKSWIQLSQTYQKDVMSLKLIFKILSLNRSVAIQTLFMRPDDYHP